MADELFGFDGVDDAVAQKKGLFFKVPRQGYLEVVILSERAHTFPVHWFERKPVRCMLPGDCPCRRAQWPTDQRYAFSVMDVATSQIGALEISAECAKEVSAYVKRFNFLRGLVLRFRKTGEKSCGRIRVDTGVHSMNPRDLPAPSDVEALVDRSFQRAEQVRLREFELD